MDLERRFHRKTEKRIKSFHNDISLIPGMFLRYLLCIFKFFRISPAFRINFPRLIFLFPSWHILHSRAKYQVQSNKDVQRLERKHFQANSIWLFTTNICKQTYRDLSGQWQIIEPHFVQIMITALFVLMQLNSLSSSKSH